MNYYITLDYELFLSSQTGTVDNCLIKPTKALLEVLDKYGVKATFFVDAAYLFRLSQIPELIEDYQKVSNHLKSLSESGHSIQLHFHPQWIYSEYKNGRWQMDMEHYKLADMSDGDINTYFVPAFHLLQTLSLNKIIAFRAGGYSLMDFNRYAGLFRDLGIYIDSSVLRNKYCQSQYQVYDYRNVPKLSKYSFLSVLTQSDPNGEFVEYPISTASLNGFISTLQTFINIKIRGKGLTKKWGDGKSVGSGDVAHSSKFKSHLNMVTNRQQPAASIDSGALHIQKVIANSVRKIAGDEVVIIGHPKNLNRLSLVNLERLINNLGKENFKTL